MALRLLRHQVHASAVAMNQLVDLVDPGSIRRAEFERAAQRLNEAFSILAMDEQVNEQRDPGEI